MISPLFCGDESTRYSQQPIIEEIQGVLLIPNQDYVCYCNTRGVRGLEAHDVCVPGGIACLAELLEPLFMGEALSRELLEQIKKQIVTYYQAHNHPVVYVYTPEQEIAHGVVQIVVLEGCVGQVAVSGNCWFPSSLYENFIHLGPGDAITADTLLTDVSWLNRNPFRNVDVVFTPGCEPGMTNIELVVCERCPLQAYVGVDNTGTSASGTDRYYAGATWGNAFWLDHILTYQYTTSHDFQEFQSHTGHYTIPLNWEHLFIAFGGYSTVKPELRDFSSEGTSWQVSGRYVIPFGCNYNGYVQEWSIGFDFKRYNNNLIFTSDEALALITKSVDLSQFMTGYAFAFENCCQRFSFNLDLYWSPGKLFPDQTNARYDELSPHAKVKYIYGKLTVGDTLFFPYNWSFAALGRLQLSSQNLLPSERFGLGGYDTVRGYRERELLVDNALVLNAELRTPCFGVLKFFGICCDDRMFFLAFFDYGLGNIDNRSEPSIDASFTGPKMGVTEYFMSFGPGWRWTICRYLAARVDWGIKLHQNPFTTKARSRWHAGLVLSY